MEPATVLSLDGVGRGDIARVGGKAASLGELFRGGFQLPPGVVVDAESYRRAVTGGGLGPIIARALAGAGVAAGEASACEAASAEIRRAFEALEVDGVAAALDGWVRPGVRYAVRSSATAEDLPDASFAGQQETFLGVRGLTRVAAAVRGCWASLWTARAISYRARQGFGHDEVALAVVVQELIDAEVAGVLFTRDPVAGGDEAMLVNASWGLGESVVSGMVTPDSWRVGRSGALVREARRGAKERRVVLCDEGTVVEPVPAEQRALSCMGDAELASLRDLGLKLEAWFGAPQDVEFAWAGGRCYLLQSRPITTAAPPSPRARSQSQRRALDDLLEHYPSAPLPLDAAAVVDGYEALQEALRDLGAALPHAREVIVMDGDGVTRLEPPPPRLSLRALALPASLLRAWDADLTAWRRVGPALPDDARLGDAPAPELLRRLRGAIDRATRLAQERFRGAIVPGTLRGAWLSALARLAGRRVSPYEWLGGLVYRTIEVEHALQRVVDSALDDDGVVALYASTPASEVGAALGGSAAGRRVLAEVEALLDAHGARAASMYLPFSTRSWREDPAALHAAVAAMLRAGERGAAMARSEAGAARTQALREEVSARLPGALRGSFERALELFRQAHVEREASLYAIEEAHLAARRAADALAERLTADGALASPRHIAFARLDELDEAVARGRDLRGVIARRRARRELAASTWRAQRPVTAPRGGAALRGIAGSPGLADGPVRVIHGIADFPLLRQGEVLVCRHTDPTWTPLFGLAAAVVADTGGPLSHAAIVAREYGVPAVLGVEVATSTLRDGQRVVVDGSQGVVRVEA